MRRSTRCLPRLRVPSHKNKPPGFVMENYQLIIRDYQLDKLGIGNVLKCLISALSINDETFIQCYPDYRYGAYDTILHPRFLFDPSKPAHKEQVTVRTCRIMLMYYEDEYQDDLPNEEKTLDPIHPNLFHWYFSKSKRIDWHYDLEKIHPKVRARVHHIIDKIVFTDAVYAAVKDWTSLFPSTGSTLGLSVRTWKSYHEQNIERPYSAEVYREKMAEVIRLHPDIRTFVVSVDHEDVVGEYMTYLTKTYPTCSFIVLQHPSSLNPIQYAIVKALTLAECTYFIGNRMSTFTELVFWFGKCRPKVYTVY